MKINKFIKIPNVFIDEKENFKKYQNMLLYIVTELCIAEDRIGRVKTTIEDLILNLNKKPNRNKGGINDKFKSIIQQLSEEGIIALEDKIDNLSVDKLIRCRLNIPYEYNENGQEIKWFKVGIQEYLKIINSKSKSNKTALINIYYYLLKNIYKRSDDINNIHITGGCSETYHDKQDSMVKHLSMTSKTTLRKHLEELNKLGLIYYGNIGRIVKDNKVKDANMVYATDEEELKEGLKQSLYYWEEQGWKLID